MSLPWRPSLPIATERLDLRAHSVDDLDDLLPFHSDPEVVRYLPWPIRTREQTIEALAIKLPRFNVTEPGGWIVLAMQLRETGQVIGEVVLKHTGDDSGELGYAMARQFHGRGYAAEAARAMVDVAFGELGLRRLTADLDARNPASARLLEKLGFTLVREYESEFKGELAPGLEYELLAP